MRWNFVILTVFAALGSGCSHTAVKTEWKDPGYSGPPARSVVVLCLPADSREKECEDEFIDELREKGIQAASGHSTVASESSQEAAIAKTRQLGIDRLLVSRFLRNKVEKEYYPSNRMSNLQSDKFVWLDYDVVERNYDVFGTELYDTTRGKPIWSAESETLVRPGEKKPLRSYVKAMIKKMDHQGLLAR